MSCLCDLYKEACQIVRWGKRDCTSAYFFAFNEIITTNCLLAFLWSERYTGIKPCIKVLSPAPLPMCRSQYRDYYSCGFQLICFSLVMKINLIIMRSLNKSKLLCAGSLTGCDEWLLIGGFTQAVSGLWTRDNWIVDNVLETSDSAVA